jgi:hypothetical protein
MVFCLAVRDDCLYLNVILSRSKQVLSASERYSVLGVSGDSLYLNGILSRSEQGQPVSEWFSV